MWESDGFRHKKVLSCPARARFLCQKPVGSDTKICESDTKQQLGVPIRHKNLWIRHKTAAWCSDPTQKFVDLTQNSSLVEFGELDTE